MPLYEYQCDACAHRFERIQKYSDPLATTCPSCGGSVRKLLSSPAIQFKGSGFYITDYAKAKSGDGSGKTDGGKDSAATDKSDKSDKSEKSGKSDKKGDSAAPTASSSTDSTTSTAKSEPAKPASKD
jgi:putative FmdB family regulatory protein